MEVDDEPVTGSAETDVCVVTHPISEQTEPAIDGLLKVIASAASSVSLVTANLPADSIIRNEYQFEEISSKDTGNSIPVAAMRFIFNQIRMCRTIYRKEEDTVLFFGATTYLLPILLARLIGRNVIIEPRGNVPQSLYHIWQRQIPDAIAYLLTVLLKFLEQVGFALSHALISLSPSMADELGMRRYESKLFEHGARPVDVDHFAPSKPFADRKKRVGYLGRLDEEKGIGTLIDIVRELPEDLTFVFIGDGAMRSTIESELAERIAEGSVETTGWVTHENVPAHLNELQLLVMTSQTEGVPTTALEAMACGTPVCATPVGGIPDVVKDGETGRLLDTASPERMAEQIEEMLADKQQLASMSEASRAFIVEQYSFEAVVDRYREVFSFVAR